ncbi:MAG: U32 family peptidase [Spirochaetia bacterium]|nr:U32 family peptidase [Spirochaetia bacterium]
MERRKLELLAPAGDYDCAKAAILAGADAVYMGLKKFNARERASNLGLEELKEIISIAHSHGTKIYVTMNTLLTDDELYEAVQCASEIFNAGADALIVQDAGLAYVLHHYLPDLELHASTQMTTHNCLQVDFLKELGIKNINFARELSADELKTIIDCTKAKGIKAEIFVHGAYCISCSGICYMSSFISSQAGNRGKCLQPCRRRYSLTPHGEKSYFFSLKDNNALPNLDRIKEIGADALKIEGRIKNYGYVYTTVSAYRHALDSSSDDPAATDPDSDVSQVFNRGFTTGYFDSCISPDMFVESPLDQSMVQAGIVLSYTADRQELAVEHDGNTIEEGSRISIYTPENSFICSAIVKDVLGQGQYRIEIENLLHGKILKGQIVALLPQPKRMQILAEQLAELKPVPAVFDAEVFAQERKPLRAVFQCQGHKAEVCSTVPLEKAQNRGLSEDGIRTQFQKTGDMLCTLGNLTCHGLEEPLFLPVKELNQVRRSALEALFATAPAPQVPHLSYQPHMEKSPAVLVSTEDDAQLFADRCDNVFVEWFPGCKVRFEKNIYPWIPAFIEDSAVQDYLELLDTKPGLVVSDNVGLGLEVARRGINWIAGPMLNSSNSYTLKAYQEQAHASGAFLSTELNRDQLSQISAPAGFRLFLQVFGPITMMTTRQCLLASAGRCRSGRNRFSASCRFCSGYETFYDEKEIPFHIVKSSGYINRVFNDALLYIPEAVSQVDADCFLLDFRALPFMHLSQENKLTIFECFKGDRSLSEKAKAAAGAITRGNWQRGF